MAVRRVLNPALAVAQWVLFVFEWLGRLIWYLIIVSNPVFLAIWLMTRSHDEEEEEEEE